MERSEVYEAIDSERNYQDRKWGTYKDHPHEVGGWLLLMQKKLNDAIKAWSENNNDYKALCEIGKVLAIGVACGEQHGLPGRSQYQPVSQKMRSVHWYKGG